MPQDRGRRERRLDLIRTILTEENIASQDELLARLEGEGFAVTQSSVSRDLRELGVHKDDGSYRLGSGIQTKDAVTEQVGALLTSMSPAGPNLLVVHTVIGGASRVGLAVDSAEWPEVVGTVAGDDTLFIACPGVRERNRIEQRLGRLQEAAGLKGSR